MSRGVPLDHVIARNVRELLDERGISHGRLAAWMRALGLDWTTNRVAQTVTLRRSTTLMELAGLCNVLKVPLDRLLAGDDKISLTRHVRDVDSGPDEFVPLAA